jgi:hypothetical protein
MMQRQAFNSSVSEEDAQKSVVPMSNDTFQVSTSSNASSMSSGTDDIVVLNNVE